MDSTTAKTINYSSAAITAGFTGYFLWKKKTQPKELAIIAVLAGLLVWFLVSQITKAIVSATNKPPKVEVPEDYVSADFSPTALTNNIEGALDDNWFDQAGGSDIGPYSDLAMLSDAELVMVYNDWQDRYYGDWGKTLTAALEGHNIYGSGLLDDQDTIRDVRDQLVTRLKSLGCN